MGGLTRAAPRVVITCEHASLRLPPEARGLGLPAEALASHVAWDEGAPALARSLARRLGAPLHLGRWSRLWVDLNRSETHRLVVPRSAFGVDVPGNAMLSRSEARARIERDWRPWRERALADLRAAAASPGGCLHLSAHSFTPVLHGEMRAVDVGLLYDPSREGELRFASRLAEELARRAGSLRVRRNQPYRGTADGFTTACRREFPPGRYAGLELEMNQALLRDDASTRRLVRLLTDAVATALPAH